jgi:hypothetical protein
MRPGIISGLGSEEIGGTGEGLELPGFIECLELWSRFTPPFIKNTEFINSRHSSALYELKALSFQLYNSSPSARSHIDKHPYRRYFNL